MLSILTFKRGGLALLFGCCLLTLSACGNSKPPKKEPTKPPVIKIDEHIQGLTKSGIVQVCNGQGPTDPNKQDETRGLNAGSRCGVCRTKLIDNEYVRTCDYSVAGTGAYECVPVKKLVKQGFILKDPNTSDEDPPGIVKIDGKDVAKTQLQGICVPVPQQCTQIGDHCDNRSISFDLITSFDEPEPKPDSSAKAAYWAGSASVSGTTFTCVGPGNGTSDYCMDECAPSFISGIAQTQCGRGQTCVKSIKIKADAQQGSITIGDKDIKGQKHIAEAWEKLCKEKGDGPCTGMTAGQLPYFASGLGGFSIATGVCIDAPCNPDNEFAKQCSNPNERCISQIQNPLPATPTPQDIDNEWDWPECKVPTTPPNKNIGEPCKSSAECIGGERVSCINNLCLEWCSEQTSCSKSTDSCTVIGKLNLDTPYAYDKGICASTSNLCNPSKSTDPTDSVALGCASTQKCTPLDLNVGLCATKDPAKTKKEFEQCDLLKNDCESGLHCMMLGAIETDDLSKSKVGRCIRSCPIGLGDSNDPSPDTWCTAIGSTQTPKVPKDDTASFQCVGTNSSTQFKGICSLNCTMDDFNNKKKLTLGSQELQCNITLSSTLTYQIAPPTSATLALGADCSSDPNACGPGLACLPGLTDDGTKYLSDEAPKCRKICSALPGSPLTCDADAGEICANPVKVNTLLKKTVGQYDPEKQETILGMAGRGVGLCLALPKKPSIP